MKLTENLPKCTEKGKISDDLPFVETEEQAQMVLENISDEAKRMQGDVFLETYLLLKKYDRRRK